MSKKNIEEIIIKATNKLIEKGKENNYLEWVKRQLAENKEVLQKTFFSEWFNNKLSDEQVLKEMSFFDIEFGRNIGIMVIKIVEKLNVEVSVRNWSVELLEFAIANILNDGFKDLELKYIFNDDKKI